MKKKILGIGSIVLLVAIIALGVIAFKNSNGNEDLTKVEKNITISVFDKENKSIYNENMETEAIYLIDALEESIGLDIEKEDSAYGAYITSINGISQGDNFYWSYYINDEYANVGVSSCKIEDGKTYKFKIEEFNY